MSYFFRNKTPDRNTRLWKRQSDFRGVYLRNGKWRAQISEGGKVRGLGGFDTAEEAARAYNEAAKKLYGRWACLNDVEGGEE